MKTTKGQKVVRVRAYFRWRPRWDSYRAGEIVQVKSHTRSTPALTHRVLARDRKNRQANLRAA